MARVLYGLCIAVLALAVTLGGLVPCFADSANGAATNAHSHYQPSQSADDLASPMHVSAQHHHPGMPHDDAAGSLPSQHPASHDHGCLNCCALCSATTVSAPTLPEAMLTAAGHEFVIRGNQLVAIQVLPDPGIPKAFA